MGKSGNFDQRSIYISVIVRHREKVSIIDLQDAISTAHEANVSMTLSDPSPEFKLTFRLNVELSEMKLLMTIITSVLLNWPKV